ncbi:MAG: DUF1080 domain-containing protein [Planctomycetes bacterium]|nr:DUF1080 domain-containing protein [Planctomycetota bacterium]
MRLLILLAIYASVFSVEENWTSLFDGTTLNGWRANTAETWSVQDGCVVATGPVSHLYWVGDDADWSTVRWTDFEVKFETKFAGLSNSGLFARVQWKDEGWIDTGYETQLAHRHAVCTSGGLWAHQNRLDQKLLVDDDKWFEVHMILQGSRIQAFINGKKTADYDGSTEQREEIKQFSQGTICLQGHGPKHFVRFRNIRMRAIVEKNGVEKTLQGDE